MCYFALLSQHWRWYLWDVMNRKLLKSQKRGEGHEMWLIMKQQVHISCLVRGLVHGWSWGLPCIRAENVFCWQLMEDELEIEGAVVLFTLVPLAVLFWRWYLVSLLEGKISTFRVVPIWHVTLILNVKGTVHQIIIAWKWYKSIVLY